MVKRRRSPTRTRRGAAAVEFAVCLPLLSLLVFGSIQACDLIYLRHALTSAAYEGSLEMARPNSTNAFVMARIDEVLALHEVSGGESKLGPGSVDVANAKPGAEITISVSAPVNENLNLHGFFPTPDTIQVRFACVR